MECLRCGYCCINHDVIIVNKPEFGIIDDNLIWKKGKERCKHLEGDKISGYVCSIHDYEWYVDTPCFAHIQIEKFLDTTCRIGLYNYNRDYKEKVNA